MFFLVQLIKSTPFSEISVDLINKYAGNVSFLRAEESEADDEGELICYSDDYVTVKIKENKILFDLKDKVFDVNEKRDASEHYLGLIKKCVLLKTGDNGNLYKFNFRYSLLYSLFLLRKPEIRTSLLDGFFYFDVEEGFKETLFKALENKKNIKFYLDPSPDQINNYRFMLGSKDMKTLDEDFPEEFQYLVNIQKSKPVPSISQKSIEEIAKIKIEDIILATPYFLILKYPQISNEEDNGFLFGDLVFYEFKSYSKLINKERAGFYYVMDVDPTKIYKINGTLQVFQQQDLIEEFLDNPPYGRLSTMWNDLGVKSLFDEPPLDLIKGGKAELNISSSVFYEFFFVVGEKEKKESNGDLLYKIRKNQLDQESKFNKILFLDFQSMGIHYCICKTNPGNPTRKSSDYILETLKECVYDESKYKQQLPISTCLMGGEDKDLFMCIPKDSLRFSSYKNGTLSLPFYDPRNVIKIDGDAGRLLAFFWFHSSYFYWPGASTVEAMTIGDFNRMVFLMGRDVEAIFDGKGIEPDFEVVKYRSIDSRILLHILYALYSLKYDSKFRQVISEIWGQSYELLEIKETHALLKIPKNSGNSEWMRLKNTDVCAMLFENSRDSIKDGNQERLVIVNKKEFKKGLVFKSRQDLPCKIEDLLSKNTLKNPNIGGINKNVLEENNEDFYRSTRTSASGENYIYYYYNMKNEERILMCLGSKNDQEFKNKVRWSKTRNSTNMQIFTKPVLNQNQEWFEFKITMQKSEFDKIIKEIQAYYIS